MDLRPCAACSELVTAGTCACPHCGAKACRRPGSGGAAAVLLGLSLVACGGDKDDTGDTGTTTTSGTIQDLYGPAYTGTTSRSLEEAAELAAELKKHSSGPLATPED